MIGARVINLRVSPRLLGLTNFAPNPLPGSSVFSYFEKMGEMGVPGQHGSCEEAVITMY